MRDSAGFIFSIERKGGPGSGMHGHVTARPSAGKEKPKYDAFKIPSQRPDGALVVSVAPKNSDAERRGIKRGNKVYGQYHDMGGMAFRVRGRVDGFTHNDVLINDGKGKFYFVDGKNVFVMSSSV